METQGYISEVFSSFQGEGGSVRGSCFGKKQLFIRLNGCNIANNAYGTRGCFFCDTPRSQRFKLPRYQYEKMPSSQKFSFGTNPIEIRDLISIIKNLLTKDLHSISFTGGEPMCQLPFLIEIAKALKTNNINHPLYLETNGTILPDKLTLIQMGRLFEYCCCDIKERSSNAAKKDQWEKLVKTELDFITAMSSLNIITFAKIIVTSHTELKDIEYIAQELATIKNEDDQSIGLAIQPVYLEQDNLKKKFSVSNSKLNQIFIKAAEYLVPENLSLSLQAHKFLELL
jgi:organic radical activating enzyme